MTSLMAMDLLHGRKLDLNARVIGLTTKCMEILYALRIRKSWIKESGGKEFKYTQRF